ncbi:hypothetical protein Dsin_012330 [Dipteronia sinensis]|uniref:BED-type domain-containing protein n=1 Tax=Dipteronia sinensis TaxID=43782 RepID=A0AAE0AII8_9ROSI|nr:hypothetical protein Dsin_012330 [Dipteronia sinensis]
MNLEHFNLNRNDYMPDEEINRLYGDFHIDIDPDPPSTTGPTGAGPSSSAQNSSKKRKTKKSMVLDSFEAIQVKQPDGIEVEHAQCKYCKSVLTSSSNGTSHLRRHREKCMASHGQVDTTRQTQLQQNPDGSVSTWQYDPDRVREHLVLYCAATDQPIDPRFKINGLEFFSKESGESLGLSETDVAEHLRTLKSQMFEIFSIYENRYSHGTAEPAPPQQQSQQQSKLMKIFCSKATTSRSSGPGSSSQSHRQRQHVELNRYLTTEYSITESDDFTTNDLLKWWHGKRNNFPILSRLACDVLAIPVSTVSSEQVFSTAERILEERRCSLAHDAVEALTCLKDWQNATFRRQHQPDTEELMDDFSNMIIEESSGSNQPTS